MDRSYLFCCYISIFNCFSTINYKYCSFSSNFLCILLKINWSYIYMSLFFIATLSAIPHWFDYFTVSLKANTMSSPTFLFFFKIVLTIVVPLPLYIYFRISLIISDWNLISLWGGQWRRFCEWVRILLVSVVVKGSLFSWKHTFGLLTIFKMFQLSSYWLVCCPAFTTGKEVSLSSLDTELVTSLIS